MASYVDLRPRHDSL